MKYLLFSLMLSFYYVDGVISTEIEDPYQVLGISRKATIKEIKHAYKALAKEWHPDKNEKPNSHEKFMAITRAYEVLSDPLKKERYDKFGSFDDPPSSHSYTHHPFDDLFGFGFGGFDNGNSFFQKHRISMRLFSHTLLERSYFQPIIIFAYSGYCQLCFHLEPIWQSVVNDLEPLGYGIGTVNAITDGNLLEKIRISRLPSIVVIVEGRVIHYRGSMQPLSAKAVRVFARDVIPNTFLCKITNHDGLRRFIDQWQSSNRISVVIFGSKENPRIRYMLTAMKYSTFTRFAYVYLSDQSTEIVKMRQALDITCFNCENILIFNDFPQEGPIARLSVSNGQQFHVDAIGEFIEHNKHLTLPRLSSQSYFDDLCPVSSRALRSLCVILMATDSSSDLSQIASFRNFVRNRGGNFKNERLQFAYVYVSKQKEFVMTFFDRLSPRERSSLQESGRGLLILWRYDQKKVRFAWLIKESINESDLQLELERYIKGVAKLDYQTALKPILDEYRPSWFSRISRTAVRMFEATWFNLTKEEALPLLSAIGTLLIIFFIGYGLSYASSLEEKSRNYVSQEIKKDVKRNVDDDDDQWHPEDPRVGPGINNNRSRMLRKQQRIMREMEPMMHELRAETYFGMIRLLKPGCRSIVVLVDEQSKDILLPQFAKHVWPFRNNKTFSFGYLMVEKNLPWFRKLLEHTLPAESGRNEDGSSMYERLKNINPRKTLGTVLVLCGWKLYFNMYHPMHTPPGKKHFLGFDDDGKDFSSEDSDVDKASREEMQTLRKRQHIKLENVLDALSNWLDRLVEGSIRRYYVPEWPNNLR
ncbi:unnamed protein product [Cercopithifilaria johnstoni]|uniref:J domain-containing protein n=1 Tax=Cercopithifilaria johnstoni TaxID=2874296 RepID=A0A8J2M3F8_9BILA|nr:unnamed protein product [Cercopithifilaria johnstoni]